MTGQPIRLHAVTHLPQGSDPLPVNAIQLPAATYISTITGFADDIPITAPGGTYVIQFSGVITNDPDTFALEGASPPYTANISSGFYHWEVQLDFQGYPRMLANGPDPTNAADYGTFSASPVWNSDLISPHLNIYMITPGTTVEYVVANWHGSGYMNYGGGFSDMEIAVALSNVQNSDAAITQATLNLVKEAPFLT